MELEPPPNASSLASPGNPRAFRMLCHAPGWDIQVGGSEGPLALSIPKADFEGRSECICEEVIILSGINCVRCETDIYFFFQNQ